MLRALIQELRNSSTHGVIMSQAVADRLNMNPTDLESLGVLDMSGPMTAGALAESMGLTTGAITGIIDRLEKAGYVERTKDPDDRRRVIVQAIRKNIAKVEAYFGGMEKSMLEGFATYSDSELALILDFMMKSNAAAKNAVAELRGQATEKQQEGTLFSEPLGNIKSGHLLFETGATKLTIVGSNMSELYRARFEHPVPNVKVRGGSVRVHYPGIPFLRTREKPAEVTLNSSIPWNIWLNGGTTSLFADLSDLTLLSFEIQWGINGAKILLPEPTGTVPIKINGGSNKVALLRPEGAEMRLSLHPGAEGLVIDGERFGPTAAEKWETAGFSRAKNRYDVEVTVGSKDMTIGTR